MALIVRSAFSGSGSPTISANTVGVICHDRPYLSLSHPQDPSSPPLDSFFQYESTSGWVRQFTQNETASVNLNCWPPFKSMNCSPSSLNKTVITVPFDTGTASP